MTERTLGDDETGQERSCKSAA